MPPPEKIPYGLINYNPIYEWDRARARKSLDELYRETLRLADYEISWYRSRGKSKGACAKAIRVIALLLFVLSTLIPLLSFMVSHKVATETLLYAGYLMTGIAAGLLLYDRYYGFTNSWTRFVLTGQDLASMRNELVDNWQTILLNTLPLNPSGYNEMIVLLLTFRSKFNDVVRTETKVWAKEFQQGLYDLSKELKTQNEQFKAEVEKQRAESVSKSASEPQARDVSQLQKDEQIALLQQAINENVDTWKTTIKNYTGVAIGLRVSGPEQQRNGDSSYCLQFSVNKKEALSAEELTAVPAVVFSHGYRIPTDVIETGAIKASTFTAENINIPKPLGCSIGRQNVEKSGTLGLRVRLADGKIYGMSCYHVLFPNELAKKRFNIHKPDSSNIIQPNFICSPSAPDVTCGVLHPLGQVSHGELSPTIDCGFFETTTEDIDSNIYRLPTATRIYDIKAGDERRALAVKFCGRTSGPEIITGVVFAISASPQVEYDEVPPLSFRNVIQLKIKACKGDSGSVVLTEDNLLLGMIFAVSDDQEYAYIIPMRTIYNRYPFIVA